MSAELAGDDLDDVVGSDRGDLVEAGAELVGEDVGEQSGAGGDELGELDVGRSELLEGAAELVGARCTAALRTSASGEPGAVAHEDRSGAGGAASDGATGRGPDDRRMVGVRQGVSSTSNTRQR